MLGAGLPCWARVSRVGRGSPDPAPGSDGSSAQRCVRRPAVVLGAGLPCWARVSRVGRGSPVLGAPRSADPALAVTEDVSAALREETCARVGRGSPDPARALTEGLPAHSVAWGDLRSTGVAGRETLPQLCDRRSASAQRCVGRPRPLLGAEVSPTLGGDRRSAVAWRCVWRPAVYRRGRSGDLATTS